MPWSTRWHLHPGVRRREQLTPGERAAKREDQISSELAMHTFQNTSELRALLEKNTELTIAVERLTKEVHAVVASSGGAGTSG